MVNYNLKRRSAATMDRSSWAKNCPMAVRRVLEYVADNEPVSFPKMMIFFRHQGMEAADFMSAMCIVVGENLIEGGGAVAEYFGLRKPTSRDVRLAYERLKKADVGEARAPDLGVGRKGDGVGSA